MSTVNLRAFLTVDDYAVQALKVDVEELVRGHRQPGVVPALVEFETGVHSRTEVRLHADFLMLDEAIRPFRQGFEVLWKKYSRGQNDGSHWTCVLNDRRTIT